MSEQARHDLVFVRAALATGVLIRGETAWVVESLCDRLEELLREKTMTADEARKASALARATGDEELREHTSIARQQWDKAIEAAAKAGKKSLTGSEIPALRMTLRPEAWAAALESLEADGFRVRPADKEQGRAAEVAW